MTVTGEHDTVADLPEQTEPSKPHERRHRRLIEWLAVIGVAVIVAFGLRLFAFQAFFVPSGSMIPTLQIGDRIIVNKLLFNYHDLHTGDIIVFHRPSGASVCADPTDGDLVKRVIATPGETISSSGQTVFINGKPLAEPFLPKGAAFGPQIVTQKLQPNYYFVMGDNRNVSCDSRYWGPVYGPSIIGKVILLVWRHNHPDLHWF